MLVGYHLNFSIDAHVRFHRLEMSRKIVREDFDALSSESSDISDDIEAVDSSEWSDSWLSSAATSFTRFTRGLIGREERMQRRGTCKDT